jgi:predicted RNA binding protein YcfA (HicA-like mRNA interferase family)
MPKLPILRAKELVKILNKAGFCEWRQKGSHLSLYREKDNKSLTVPVHFSKSIPKGTLRAIIREAGLTVEEFLSFKK